MRLIEELTVHRKLKVNEKGREREIVLRKLLIP